MAPSRPRRTGRRAESTRSATKTSVLTTTGRTTRSALAAIRATQPLTYDQLHVSGTSSSRVSLIAPETSNSSPTRVDGVTTDPVTNQEPLPYQSSHQKSCVPVRPSIPPTPERRVRFARQFASLRTSPSSSQSLASPLNVGSPSPAHPRARRRTAAPLYIPASPDAAASTPLSSHTRHSTHHPNSAASNISSFSEDDPFVATPASSNHSRNRLQHLFEAAASTPRSTPRGGRRSTNNRFITPNRQREIRRIKAKGKHSRSPDLAPFFIVKDADPDKDLTCLLCEHQAQQDAEKHIHVYASKTSTGVLRKHLATMHCDQWIASCDHLKIALATSESKIINDAINNYRTQHGQPFEAHRGQKNVPEFSHDAFVDALVEWIVSDDQSFNVIENAKLRAVFLMLRKELRDGDIPHRTKIRERVMEIWDVLFKELSEEMKQAVGKISFTQDMWSDSNMRGFMGVTAHWIQKTIVRTPVGTDTKLVLRSDLVGFLLLPENHSGENMAHAFIHILDRLAITEKLGWITMDNASNNDSFVTELRFLLRDRHLKVKFSKTNRIRCFPHIVNLACQAVIEGIMHIAFDLSQDTTSSNYECLGRDPLAALRDIIRTIRSSSIRREYFSRCVQALQKGNLQLLRDMEVRWSSTFLMIERALLLRAAIDVFLKDHNIDIVKLNDAEWHALSVWQEILQIPHLFQQLLSFQTTPTLSHTLPAFEALINQWQEAQTKYPEAAQIISRGIDKLDEYIERLDYRQVPAYSFAMLVDPNYKLQWFEENRPYDAGDIKIMFVNELNNSYSPLETSRSSNLPLTTQAEEPLDEYAALQKRMGIPRSGVPNRPMAGSAENEAVLYFADKTYNGGSILDWWHANQSRYPRIFAMAMDYIPIQGSAVPCERVFSSAKETITMRRNRLSPETMEATQMLKYAFNHGVSLDFTTGWKKADELQELEEFQNFLLSTPPCDTAGFVQALNTAISSSVHVSIV